MIRPRSPWRSVDHVDSPPLDVDWVNHRRLYRYCGEIPPAEMEARLPLFRPNQQSAGLSPSIPSLVTLFL
ncbi:hypothetical protein [Nocardia araoensis]|uniref:hypothetical protein n=1 Tax=Nocardia araoensis TaxID=228600 RepID=UPI0002D7767D|nr:hypothetical protein [Nocardia araoensis]